jgi:hypothetical protein
MAITVTTAMCDSFKKEILMGSHLFKAAAGHTFKLCLLKATAAGSGTYSTATTNYGSGAGSPTTSNVGTDEATDTSGNARYTAGGFTMTPNADPTIGTNIAWVDWTTDPNWGTDATISSYGGLLYNSTASGLAVATLAWGADKTCTTGTFTVTLPAPAFTTALLRI